MASTMCTRAIYSLLSSIRTPHLLQEVGLPCFSVSLPHVALAVYMHPLLHLAETLFQVVLFRSLRDAPSCESLLESCLQVLSPGSLVRVSQALSPLLSR